MSLLWRITFNACTFHRQVACLHHDTAASGFSLTIWWHGVQHLLILFTSPALSICEITTELRKHLSLRGSCTPDRILFSRNRPRQYGIDNIQGRLTWKKGLSTWRYAPQKKDRQPHGRQSVIKVLCYSDTELNSEPILWIASRIFRVVFSPGKATPLLYWRILLSLMPANWAKRLALIKSKSSKKEGMS